ncbi:MAG: hypothetical protein FWB92_02830 [Oscillospiraceae bacterium]|nr:hypothetical protein [Oscillospiraceae bacterium]
MKKIFHFILLTVLTVIMLAGCGSSRGTEQAFAPNEPSAAVIPSPNPTLPLTPTPEPIPQASEVEQDNYTDDYDEDLSIMPSSPYPSESEATAQEEDDTIYYAATSLPEQPALPPATTSAPVVTQTWQEAYAAYLRERAGRMASGQTGESLRYQFFLHDIDGNGIPELFYIVTGWHPVTAVYTFRNNEMVALELGNDVSFSVYYVITNEYFFMSAGSHGIITHTDVGHVGTSWQRVVINGNRLEVNAVGYSGFVNPMSSERMWTIDGVSVSEAAFYRDFMGKVIQHHPLNEQNIQGVINNWRPTPIQVQQVETAPSWQEAYAAVIRRHSGRYFSLQYISGSNVPELLIATPTLGSGWNVTNIYNYINNQAVSLSVSHLSGSYLLLPQGNRQGVIAVNHPAAGGLIITEYTLFIVSDHSMQSRFTVDDINSVRTARNNETHMSIPAEEVASVIDTHFGNLDGLETVNFHSVSETNIQAIFTR